MFFVTFLAYSFITCIRLNGSVIYYQLDILKEDIDFCYAVIHVLINFLFWKNVRITDIPLHVVFPILYYHGTFINTKKLAFIHYC